MRALFLTLWTLSLGGLGVWVIQQPPLAHLLSGPSCSSVFATPSDLTPRTADTNEPYLVSAQLKPQRPDVTLVYQIIDHNGFGWLLRPYGRGDPLKYQMVIPHDYRVKTVRVGLLAPSETDRAQEIAKAASVFDVRTWRRLRGWEAPNLSLCQTFDLGDG